MLSGLEETRRGLRQEGEEVVLDSEDGGHHPEDGMMSALSAWKSTVLRLALTSVVFANKLEPRSMQCAS